MQTSICTNYVHFARVLTLLAALGFAQNALAVKPDTFLTTEVSSFIDAMVEQHEGAFIATCMNEAGSGRHVARIIFFPRKNKGMFVYENSDRIVSNNANITWAEDGQWDMSDLEGGTETIRIMSDLFYQLTRQPFSWAAPSDVRKASQALPNRTCQQRK